MRGIAHSNRFKKDIKLCQKQGKDMNKLKTILDILKSTDPLPIQYKDHPLKGKWTGFRDLHIEPDWVLVYRIENDIIFLSATGSHAYIFES
jgi:mRNA interferase YafQ